MGRTPCCEKNGLKKGPWTAEEDQKLIDYIQQHGQGRWRTVPKNAGLRRCGKSCRLRWTNYLRPDIKRGRFSFEEEEIIIQLHSIWGNKWSAIASRLPGRTDNEIKNYWNTHIRKRLLRMGIDPVTHSPRLDLLDQLSSILSSSLCNPTTQLMNVQSLLGLQSMVNNIPSLPNLATALVSSQYKNLQSDLQQTLLENQFQFFQGNDQPQNTIQEFQACKTSTASTSSTTFPSLFNDTKLLQANADQFSHDTNNFSCLNGHLPSLYQNNEQSFNMALSIAPQINFGYANDVNYQSWNKLLTQNQDFQSNNSNNVQSSGFGSILPTPSSSPSPLNSSCTTHVLGSPENDEKDYCSNTIFHMANNFDVDGFM